MIEHERITESKSSIKGMLLFMLVVTIFQMYCIPIVIGTYVAMTGETNVTSFLYIIIQESFLVLSIFILFVIRKQRMKRECEALGHSTDIPIKAFINYRLLSIRELAAVILVSCLSFASFHTLKNAYISALYSYTLNDNLITSLGYVPNAAYLILLCIVTSMLPAFAEEIYFRGVIFNGLRHKNRIIAYILTAFFFAFSHGSIAQLVQAIFFGLILCMVYEKTGSIIAPILTHFIYNLFGLMINYFFSIPYGLSWMYNNGYTSNDIRTGSIFLALVGFWLFAALIFIVSRIFGSASKTTKKDIHVYGFSFAEIALICASCLFVLIRFALDTLIR